MKTLKESLSKLSEFDGDESWFIDNAPIILDIIETAQHLVEMMSMQSAHLKEVKDDGDRETNVSDLQH